MRVLTLTNLYPNPFQPNRATYNRCQLTNLGRLHNVQVISPIAWTDEFKARRGGKPALPKNRRVVHDDLVVDHPRYFYPPKFGRRWHGNFYLMSVARTFRRAVKEFSPDVVFAPWAYPDGWAAGRLAEQYGLPVVVKCHGSDVLLLDEVPARRIPTIVSVRAADRVVAVSQHIATRLIEMGVEPRRIKVIVCGVEPHKFHAGSKDQARAKVGLSNGPPIVLFVGNLVRVKGIDVLLNASARLLKAKVEHRLIIIGEGPLRAVLEQQAVREGLSGIVQFKGVVNHEDLPDWYRAADLFVLPSRSEGIPNVLLEASACDTQWVASSVGGIPEIADLGRSRLVKPESSTDLAEAIHAMLEHPPARSANSPRSPATAATELAELLSEVVASTRSGGHSRLGTA